MSAGTLADYLGHIQQAADNACAYVEGLCKKDFLADRRTQDAVVLSVFIIGEAAARIMDQHPAFVARHPDLPWRSMRGMRNRIAHGYFEINLDVVWETLCSDLPELRQRLPGLMADAGGA